MSELQMLIEHIGTTLSAEQVLQMLQFKLDKIQQVGDILRAFCPIHKDEFLRTLNVDPNRRRFVCNYAKCPGHKGGSFFHLYKLAQEMTDLEAAKYLAEVLGLPIHSSLLDATEEDVAEESVKEHDVASGEQEEEISPEMLELLRVPSDVEDEEQLSALVEDAVHGLEEDFQLTDEGEEVEGVPSEAIEPAEEVEPLEETEIDVNTEPPVIPEAPPQETVAEPAEQQPADWEALYEQGVSLFEGNRYSQAEEVLLQAMAAAPTDAERSKVILTLGKCYLETQKPSDTIELLADGLEMPDLMPPMHKAMLKMLSTAYERKGDTARAAEILRNLTSKYGDDPEANNRLRKIEEKLSPQNTKDHQERRISFL